MMGNIYHAMMYLAILTVSEKRSLTKRLSLDGLKLGAFVAFGILFVVSILGGFVRLVSERDGPPLLLAFWLTTSLMHVRARLRSVDGSARGFVGLFSDNGLRSELVYGEARGLTHSRLGDRVVPSLPTPGSKNLAAAASVAAPELDPAHGVYPGSIDVAIRSVGSPIRYTLDGTTPSGEHGLEYRGPIAIERSTVVRAIALGPSGPSEVATQSYFVSLGCAESSLPIVALSGDPSTVFFNPAGLLAVVGGELSYDASFERAWKPLGPKDYSHPMIRGLERRASIELLAAPEGPCRADAAPFPSAAFDAGLRVHGGDWGRVHIRSCPLEEWANDWSCKHSFRIHLRGRYGAKVVKGPSFGEPGIERQKTLILANPTDKDGSIPHNDAILRALGRSFGLSTPRGRFVSLFVNARYAGLYELLERPDERWAKLTLESDEVELVDQEGVRSGSGDRFRELLRAADDRDLDTLDRVMELDAFLDYVLLQLYAANADWPDNNWIAMAKQNGRFVFVAWDGEDAFKKQHLSANGLSQFPDWAPDGGRGLAGDSPVARIFQALMTRPQLRERLGSRARQALSTGPLSKSNLLKAYGDVHAKLIHAEPKLESFIGDVWIERREEIFEAQLEAFLKWP
ncbi:MAG: CotH kinase family protein [Deltaproteobacteria bacterium]|nr:CotH kinase family protein [Deltaproteobacteria bacterium]